MLQMGETILAERGAVWGDRVRIIACNLDEDLAAPQGFLAQVKIRSAFHTPYPPCPLLVRRWAAVARVALACEQ